MVLTDEDHLHIRGENKILDMCCGSKMGSPPHTWRKPNSTGAFHCSLRITSTYVEKTRTKERYKVIYEDHLHIRGENLEIYIEPTQCMGSPPHTWRKPSLPEHSKTNLGITSTYVEKTNCTKLIRNLY